MDRKKTNGNAEHSRTTVTPMRAIKRPAKNDRQVEERNFEFASWLSGRKATIIAALVVLGMIAGSLPSCSNAQPFPVRGELVEPHGPATNTQTESTNN